MGPNNYVADSYSQPYQNAFYGYQQQNYFPSQAQNMGRGRRVSLILD